MRALSDGGFTREPKSSLHPSFVTLASAPVTSEGLTIHILHSTEVPRRILSYHTYSSAGHQGCPSIGYGDARLAILGSPLFTRVFFSQFPALGPMQSYQLFGIQRQLWLISARLSLLVARRMCLCVGAQNAGVLTYINIGNSRGTSLLSRGLLSPAMDIPLWPMSAYKTCICTSLTTRRLTIAR